MAYTQSQVNQVKTEFNKYVSGQRQTPQQQMSSATTFVSGGGTSSWSSSGGTQGNVIKKSSSQPMSTQQTPTPSAEVKTTNTVPAEVRQDIRKSTPTVTEYKSYIQQHGYSSPPTYSEYEKQVKKRAVFERGVKEGEYTKKVTPFETIYTPVGEAPVTESYQGVNVNMPSGSLPQARTSTEGLGTVSGIGSTETGLKIESSGTSENLPRMSHGGLTEADYLGAANRMVISAGPLEQLGFNIRAALGSESSEYTGAVISAGLGTALSFSAAEANPIAAMSGNLKVQNPLSGTQNVVRKQIASDIRYSMENERPDMSFVRGVKEAAGSVPVQIMASYGIGGALGYGVTQIPQRFTTASKIGLAGMGLVASGIEGTSIASSAIAGETNVAIGKTAGFIGSLGSGIAGFKAGYGVGTAENLAVQTHVKGITSINRFRGSAKASVESNQGISRDITKGVMNVNEVQGTDVISSKDINMMVKSNDYKVSKNLGTSRISGVRYEANIGLIPKEKVLPKSDYYSVITRGVKRQVGLYGEIPGGRAVFRGSATSEVLYPQSTASKGVGFDVLKPSKIKYTELKVMPGEQAAISPGASARSNLFMDESARLADKAANFDMFQGRPLQGAKVTTTLKAPKVTSGAFESYAIPLPEEQIISFAPVPSSMLSQQPRMQQPTNANLAQAYTGLITYSIMGDLLKDVRETITIPNQRSVSRQMLKQNENVMQQTRGISEINDVINTTIPVQSTRRVQRQLTRQRTRNDLTTTFTGFGGGASVIYPSLILPKFEFPKQKNTVSSIRKAKQSFRYTPSLTAIALGIEGTKPPKGTWGVALRPLQVRRKHKKKKR